MLKGLSQINGKKNYNMEEKVESLPQSMHQKSSK